MARKSKNQKFVPLPLSPQQQPVPPPSQTMAQPTTAGTSQSWTSPAALQTSKFQRIQNSASHLGFAQSPFFPKTTSDWARHQAEYAQDRMEWEKERLRRKIEEREVRRKIEGGAREDREEVERRVGRVRGLMRGEGEVIEEQMGGLKIGGEGEAVNLHEHDIEEQVHEQELARTRAGKAKDLSTGVTVSITEIENESEAEEETGSSEQIDSGANENESKKKRKKRGKKKGGSKAKNATNVESPIVERAAIKNNKENVKPSSAAGGASIPKPTPKPDKAGKKSTAAADTAASLLGSTANDPLLKSVLAGGKPPNSSLWRAFTQSSLYNADGSVPALNAMFASLPRAGHTPILSAPTSIWAGNEHLKPEGKRNPVTGKHRSAWPSPAEMKAEGQYRKEAGKERRLPLPRMDVMTKDAVVKEVGGAKLLGMLKEEGKDAVVKELGKRSGDEIAWMDREPVRFEGFDRLEGVEKEMREENARRREEEPVCGPNTYVHGHGGMGGQMGGGHRGGLGPNMGLRGGFSQSSGGRRQTGPLAPIPTQPQPKPVDPSAICYGADGPGDGKAPPPGGWVFDEEFLKGKGDWEDLLGNLL